MGKRGREPPGAESRVKPLRYATPLTPSTVLCIWKLSPRGLKYPVQGLRTTEWPWRAGWQGRLTPELRLLRLRDPLWQSLCPRKLLPQLWHDRRPGT